MSAERVLTIDGEVIQVGTSLFRPATGAVYWCTEVGERVVHLEGVEETETVDVDRLVGQLADGALIVESQPPGRRS
ncbi:MAG: hypothetical protein ABEJ08_05650 [Halobacteriaceae archaeon]